MLADILCRVPFVTDAYPAPKRIIGGADRGLLGKGQGCEGAPQCSQTGFAMPQSQLSHGLETAASLRSQT